MNLLPLFLRLLPVALLTLTLSSCKDRSLTQNVNFMVTSEAKDGLDLAAVTSLLKTVKDAEALENRLNSSEEPRINNLDLDENDQVDYIQVTEYKEGNITGFSLTTELAEGDVQEIATIEIETTGDNQATVQTHGNSQIYGNGHYHYYRGPSVMDYVFMSYIFSNHRPYGSSYGYNRYPSSYSRATPLSSSNYRSNVSQLDTGGVTRSSQPAFNSSKASPNQARSSSRIKAPLKNPTASQRAFQQRNPSRSIRSGGFGSGSSTRSTGSFRTSSRSGSSFGGGK